MKRIIALSGPSGAGKSHARKNDPELVQYRQLDIADYYARNPGISSYDAFSLLISHMMELLEVEDTVVLEACFFKTSRQRRYLQGLCDYNGWALEYREFDAPPEVRRERILKQHEEGIAAAVDDDAADAWHRYTSARLEMLEAGL